MAQDALSSGFVDLCIDTSLNFFDGKCRMLVEGQYFDSGQGCSITEDVIVKVSNARDIDCQFGAGSVLSAMLKIAFCVCPDNVEIFALPRKDAVGSTKAVYEMTVTGTALTGGSVPIFFGNSQYAVNVAVEAGDTANDIAMLIANAMSADFPYDVTALANVLTFTAKNGGTIGNYLSWTINPLNQQYAVPDGVTIDGVRTVTGAGNPDPLDISSLVGDCCYNCYVSGFDDGPIQTAMRDHIRSAWDCGTPQCFGHGFVFNTGTVGEIVARGDNSAELSRLAHCPDGANFPYELVANYAALRCCSACDNPEISIQGRELGVLSCVTKPQSCGGCFSYDEQVALKEAGFVVYGDMITGSGAYTYPYIFNDVTNYLYDGEGRENATYRDTNSRYLGATTAIAIAEKLSEFDGLGWFTKNTAIKKGTQGTNPTLMKAELRKWAKDNVGVLFSDFDDLDESLILETDFDVAAQCQGNPNKAHLKFQYRPPVRLGTVVTTLQPKLLDNCDR